MNRMHFEFVWVGVIKFYSTRVLSFPLHTHIFLICSSVTSTYLDFSKFGLWSLCWFKLILYCCEFWNFHMEFASEYMCYAHALLTVMLFHSLAMSILSWKWKWKCNVKSLMKCSKKWHFHMQFQFSSKWTKRKLKNCTKWLNRLDQLEIESQFKWIHLRNMTESIKWFLFFDWKTKNRKMWTCERIILLCHWNHITEVIRCVQISLRAEKAKNTQTHARI